MFIQKRQRCRGSCLSSSAADDFMLDGHNITYEGSNLGLGAGSEDAAEFDMYLHNTKITTGGNLAAGTLGKLSISELNLSLVMLITKLQIQTMYTCMQMN